MHIDKYLCDVNLPEFQPGPFAVRLKYELKQSFFDKRKTAWMFHFVYSTAILGLLAICIFLVVNPHVANNMNTIVFGEQETTESSLEMLLLAERDIDVSNFPSGIRTVSSNTYSPLPFIEENTVYVIYKFTNEYNQTLFYINQIRQRPAFRQSF
jgi:hypothetical protein